MRDKVYKHIPEFTLAFFCIFSLPEELYQAFLEIGREELVFHSKKQKTIEEITELMIRVKPGLRILRDEVVSAGRMGEHILLYDEMFVSVFRLNKAAL